MSTSFLRQSKHILTSFRKSHPYLKHISLITISLIVVWIYVIYQGERASFTSKIAACDWRAWENLDEVAQPHRAVLIADSQLVDAHTYPGRPWPLSTLTELFTDRYMARSFKMMNEQLDPDSIIFLGDLLDGGREWAPARARDLTKTQKYAMQVKSPATGLKQNWEYVIDDPGWSRDGLGKRAAASDEQRTDVMPDFTEFKVSEDRWKRYGHNYWQKEYNRLCKIFFTQSQVYPLQDQALQVISQRQQDAVNVENGAEDRLLSEYGIVGKIRNILPSLPGNHDLGFGSGVQLSVRARYKAHFGEPNRVDVLGNFTFVSIDALSLAAWSQFESDGAETQGQDAKGRQYQYTPAQNFLDNLSDLVETRIDETLGHFYPRRHPGQPHWPQMITNLSKEDVSPSKGTSTSQTLPVILLSHVPLYREPDTDCGSLRERGHSLSITGGFQYQNVLTRTLSNTIANKLSNAGTFTKIFSGDDHDYCNITHQYAVATASNTPYIKVNEETVKSFSWAMGVRHPGFMLVSLHNPVDENGLTLTGHTQAIQTHMCLLPDQLAIFIRYASLLGITLTALLLRAITLTLRSKTAVEDEELPESGQLRLINLIPSSIDKLRSLANGYKQTSKHRHRASSSAIKPPNDNLSVQRSYNARTRSVSPGIGYIAQPFFPARSRQSSPAPSSFTEQYLQPRVDDSYLPSDDEESRIGDMDYLDDDTQAKWRRRKRPSNKITQALHEFLGSLSFVAIIAGCYYSYMIRL